MQTTKWHLDQTPLFIGDIDQPMLLPARNNHFMSQVLTDNKISLIAPTDWFKVQRIQLEEPPKAWVSLSNNDIAKHSFIQIQQRLNDNNITFIAFHNPPFSAIIIPQVRVGKSLPLIRQCSVQIEIGFSIAQ